MNVDFYEVLGLKSTCSDNEIKQAYKKVSHANKNDILLKL